MRAGSRARHELPGDVGARMSFFSTRGRARIRAAVSKSARQSAIQKNGCVAARRSGQRQSTFLGLNAPNHAVRVLREQLRREPHFRYPVCHPPDEAISVTALRPTACGQTKPSSIAPRTTTGPKWCLHD